MAPLPFDPSSLTPSGRALYEAMVNRRKEQGAAFGGPYAALMNHPELRAKIEDLGYYLKFQGCLPRNIYQFVVLSVARSTRAAFEWIDHVAHAEAAWRSRVRDRDAATNGLQDGAFEAPYDLAAKVLAATLAWRDISPSVQEPSIERFGMQGFVELVVLSGFYQMFAGINQGFAVSPPRGAENPF